MINREEKRRKTVAKFADKTLMKLNAIINDSKLSDEERFAARLQLQRLPRDTSLVRQRNRCALTGRARGTFRKFGLGRSKVRETMRGENSGRRQRQKLV